LLLDLLYELVSVEYLKREILFSGSGNGWWKTLFGGSENYGFTLVSRR